MISCVFCIDLVSDWFIGSGQDCSNLRVLSKIDKGECCGDHARFKMELDRRQCANKWRFVMFFKYMRDK